MSSAPSVHAYSGLVVLNQIIQQLWQITFRLEIRYSKPYANLSVTCDDRYSLSP